MSIFTPVAQPAAICALMSTWPKHAPPIFPNSYRWDQFWNGSHTENRQRLRLPPTSSCRAGFEMEVKRTSRSLEIEQRWLDLARSYDGGSLRYGSLCPACVPPRQL
jgi:hypothetical protein